MFDVKKTTLVLLFIAFTLWIVHKSEAEQKIENFMHSNKEVSPVAQIRGTASAIAVKGMYAYVGFGDRFAIVDIANQLKPTEVGDLKLGTSNEEIQMITIGDEIAYITTYDGLYAVEISDLAKPRQLSFYAVQYAVAQYMTTPYLYIAVENTLEVLDTSNPSDIIVVSKLEIFPYSQYVFSYMAYFDNHLFVGGPDTLVIDIEDPTNPIIVARWSTNSPMDMTSNRLFTTEDGCASQCYGYLHISEWDKEALAEPKLLDSGTFVLSTNQISGLESIDFDVYMGTADGVYRTPVSGDKFQAADLLDMTFMRAGVAQGDYVYLVGNSGFYIFERPPTKKVYLPLIAR